MLISTAPCGEDVRYVFATLAIPFPLHGFFPAYGAICLGVPSF